MNSAQLDSGENRYPFITCSPRRSKWPEVSAKVIGKPRSQRKRRRLPPRQARSRADGNHHRLQTRRSERVFGESRTAARSKASASACCGAALPLWQKTAPVENGAARGASNDPSPRRRSQDRGEETRTSAAVVEPATKHARSNFDVRRPFGTAALADTQKEPSWPAKQSTSCRHSTPARADI